MAGPPSPDHDRAQKIDYHDAHPDIDSRAPGGGFCWPRSLRLRETERREPRSAHRPRRIRSAGRSPGLYLEIARRKAEAADKLYDAGNAEAGKAALQDVVTYSKKATDSSIETGKKLKNIEITLRKMAEKFRDVKRTVAFDDQAPIQQTVDELEKMRTDLLSAMFGKKKSQ